MVVNIFCCMWRVQSVCARHIFCNTFWLQQSTFYIISSISFQFASCLVPCCPFEQLYLFRHLLIASLCMYKCLAAFREKYFQSKRRVRIRTAVIRLFSLHFIACLLYPAGYDQSYICLRAFHMWYLSEHLVKKSFRSNAFLKEQNNGLKTPVLLVQGYQ